MPQGIAQRRRTADAALQVTVGKTQPVSSVVAVLRYPLKSSQGERLQSVAVDPNGALKDRAWACVDLSDGTVSSAKHPRRRLLEVTARSTTMRDRRRPPRGGNDSRQRGR